MQLTLTNARVLDGRGGVLERATVRIEYGLIAAVDSGGDGAGDGERDGDGVIDLAGRTLMPGLIDAHVHCSSYPEYLGIPQPRRGEAAPAREMRYFALARGAADLLRAGITTVRDVGSFDDEQIHLRDAIRLGLASGPRILHCGRIISATAPGGVIFASMYREADGADEMRKAVREQLRRGADFIKLMATGARSVLLEDPEPAQMTQQECEALIDEAHRMGRRVAAHVEGLAGAQMVLAAGVDTVEHGLSLHREPALLAAMAESGTILVPTLSTFHDVSETHACLYPARLVEQAERQREEAYTTLVAARDAGVVMAMGFDSAPHGDNVLELVRMVDGGLTSMEGIVAATTGSARALGLERELGGVAPGLCADLIVVDGDPLADVRVLADADRIWLVVQAGAAVAGRALDAGSAAGLTAVR